MTCPSLPTYTHLSSSPRLVLYLYRAYFHHTIVLILSSTVLPVQVRVIVDDPVVGVDAVLVESQANEQLCKPCKAVRYVVERQPPFPQPDGTMTSQRTTSENWLTDTCVHDK